MRVNYWLQRVLHPPQFEALLICFKYHWEEYYSQYTLEGKPRQRLCYNRKPRQLPLMQDKLLFILVYLKTNLLQEVQEVHFEMTQPQANLWIHLLADILSKTLRTLGELPWKIQFRLTP